MALFETYVCVDEIFVWSVVFGTFLANVVVLGFLRCYSVLLLAYQTHAEAPLSLMLLTFGFLSASIAIMSPVSTWLSSRFTTRLVVTVSALGACVSCMAISFTRSIYWYLPLVSVLGLSLGLTYGPVMCMPSRCHVRRITLANSLGSCGSGIGVVLSAPLMEFLLSSFAVQGSFLVFGAVFLNLIVCAQLMPTIIFDSSGKHILFHETFLRRKREAYLPRILPVEDEAAAEKIPLKEVTVETVSKPPDKFASVWKEYGVVNVVTFILILTFIGYGHSAQFSTLAGYGAECGLSSREVTYHLMLSGITDIVARIFFAWMNDLRVLPQGALLFTGALCMGTNCVLVAAIPASSWAFSVYVLVNAVASAAYMGTFLAFVTHTFSVRYFAQVYTSILVCQSCFNIGGQLCLSMIISWSGKYAHGIQAIGVLLWIAVLAAVVKRILACKCRLPFWKNSTKS